MNHRKSYWKTVLLASAVLVADVAVLLLWLIRGAVILSMYAITSRQHPGLYRAAVLASGFIASFCCFTVLGGVLALLGDASEAGS